jgi:excisionase family DNA binding protein
MIGNFISVKEASDRVGYSESHIRNLLDKGTITGEKIASVWLVDATSIEKYRARMERLGNKKHGVWAVAQDASPISRG